MLVVGGDGAVGLAVMLEVVGVLVIVSVSEFFHHFGRSVTDLERDGEVAVVVDVFFRSDVYSVGDIVFGGFRQIEGELENGSPALWHSEFLYYFVDLVGEE